MSKIVLEVDVSEAGATLSEILKSLSEEQRKDVALQMMQAWLSEPIPAERESYEREMLQTFRRKAEAAGTYDSARHFKRMSDDEIRKHYEFRGLTDKYRSLRETTIDAIRTEMVAHVREHVKRVVAEEPQIQALTAETVRQVFKVLPGFLLEHLLGNLARGVIEASTQQASFDGMMARLRGLLPDLDAAIERSSAEARQNGRY